MNRIDERERHLRQHLVDRHCDYSAEELRTHARRSKDVSQSRRLLSLAVRDGMDRAAAVKIGGMDRQTLRDWVHRFNVSGPEGLIDNRTEGRKPRLSEEQLAQSAKIVEAGPDREKDGIVRWRRVDLKRVIAERFGVRRKSRRKADRPRSGLQRVQPVIITFSKCFLILGP